MRGGLPRVTGLAFMAKHFAIRDWLIFSEVFGMPVRIARYDPKATPEEKRELLRMMQSLGSDAAGIFSKAVERKVRTGRHSGDQVEIVDGVKAGDPVIVQPGNIVTGEPVRLAL